MFTIFGRKFDFGYFRLISLKSRSHIIDWSLYSFWRQCGPLYFFLPFLLFFWVTFSIRSVLGPHPNTQIVTGTLRTAASLFKKTNISCFVNTHTFRLSWVLNSEIPTLKKSFERECSRLIVINFVVIKESNEKILKYNLNLGITTLTSSWTF